MKYHWNTPAADEPADKKHDPDRTSEQQTLDEWGIGIGPPENSGGSSGWYTDEDAEAHHDAMFALNLARAWAQRKISELPTTLSSLIDLHLISSLCQDDIVWLLLAVLLICVLRR